MKRIGLLFILCLSIVSLNAQSEIEVGTIAQVTGNTVIIKYKDVSNPLKMNQLLHTTLPDNKPAILKVIYPMQTSAKCKIVKGNTSELRKGIVVYEGDKVVKNENIKIELEDIYDVRINPDNGHKYFLSMVGTWQQVEEEAVLAGGHLVTIRNGKEEDWIKETFGRGQTFWIGLRPEGTFNTIKWVSGEDSDYRNWKVGQPYLKFNCGGVININQDPALEILHNWGVFDKEVKIRGIIEVVKK